MKRLFALTAMLLFLATSLTAVAQDKATAAKVKEALGELHEFIGQWKGTTGPETRPKEFWKESLEWGWKFKGDEAWLVVKFTDNKAFKSGDLKYDVAAKKYTLNMVTVDGKTRDYKGDLKKGSLILEAPDATSKETHKLTMNTAAEGVKFIYYTNKKPEGSTLWSKDLKGDMTKVGESLGPTAKKNECVVSGGLGTMQVSGKGMTFYVCCSGCRDAFNENPDKYIKEWEERKKKKK